MRRYCNKSKGWCKGKNCFCHKRLCENGRGLALADISTVHWLFPRHQLHWNFRTERRPPLEPLNEIFNWNCRLDAQTERFCFSPGSFKFFGADVARVLQKIVTVIPVASTISWWRWYFASNILCGDFDRVGNRCAIGKLYVTRNDEAKDCVLATRNQESSITLSKI